MIYFVIVIYNKYLNNSDSFQSVVENLGDNKIVVIDNSDKPFFLSRNKNDVDSHIAYIQNGLNLGLSRSYNKALKYIGRNSFSDNNYICWLDDDTVLDKSFFKVLSSETRRHYDVIVPKIIGQDGVIYSPNEKGFLKNRLVLNRKSGEINPKKFNAINSCLTVKTSIYRDYVYDERLFLDQVDQLFFDSIRSRRLTYRILNVQIEQNFSQREKKLDKTYLTRFAIRTKDMIEYGKISPCSSMPTAYLKNLLLGLYFSVKISDFSFLKVSIKSLMHPLTVEGGHD
ncbi:glycosyltransferase [Oenococcus kitaharae]|uniref:Putative glycosyl transferase n=1 Tax=Oenococcus kitaharae DSM 17330 TaxID=1045004 RepID=G9WIQ6_9LACO|nr:glycosyltransferase [Oenococcus kitaharae]EHN58195.1 putative glycosyl transferase [Oenococcus kitaharae DSM 17330]OEY81614.1 hypothetical protein NT95_08995 [Oenococcus kitaharae]OEY83099.1 hypothetical protein NV75_07095 [Oenococcus kitaharae]OEY84355.1 hypothetical protein NT96_03540 [Oenococcus kitaharae]